MSKKFSKCCEICENKFDVYPSGAGRKYCSKECRSKGRSINCSGENNPNYGNRWSDEKRLNFSEYQKSISSEISERTRLSWVGADERRENTSKLMSELGKERIGEKNTFYGKKHSNETLCTIAKKSSAKFTEDFKIKFRETMEELGRWRKREDIDDYEIYYIEANWIEKMFDKIEDVNQLKLLNEYGVYSNINKQGVVRDHIYGRTSGFTNGVYPEILRHPANCQLLHMRDNVSKGQRGSNRLDTDISLIELFEKIKCYNGNWDEHDKVKILIDKYEKGDRWRRDIIKQGGLSDECLLHI